MPRKELEKLLFKAVADALGVELSKDARRSNGRDDRHDEKRIAA